MLVTKSSPNTGTIKTSREAICQLHRLLLDTSGQMPAQSSSIGPTGLTTSLKSSILPSAEFVFVNPSKDSDVLDLSLQVSVPGLAPFYSVALRSAVRGKYHLLTGVGEDVKLVVDLPSNASPKMIYEAARMFEDEVATLVRAYCSMYSDNLTSPRHHTTPVADLQIEARDDLSSIIQTALARVSKALGFETSDS